MSLLRYRSLLPVLVALLALVAAPVTAQEAPALLDAYPNPVAHDALTVRYAPAAEAAEAPRAVVYDVLGRKVALGHVAAGTYVVVLEGAEGARSAAFRFTKLTGGPLAVRLVADDTASPEAGLTDTAEAPTAVAADRGSVCTFTGDEVLINGGFEIGDMASTDILVNDGNGSLYAYDNPVGTSGGDGMFGFSDCLAAVDDIRGTGRFFPFPIDILARDARVAWTEMGSIGMGGEMALQTTSVTSTGYMTRAHDAELCIDFGYAVDGVEVVVLNGFEESARTPVADTDDTVCIDIFSDTDDVHLSFLGQAIDEESGVMRGGALENFTAAAFGDAVSFDVGGTMMEGDGIYIINDVSDLYTLSQSDWMFEDVLGGRVISRTLGFQKFGMALQGVQVNSDDYLFSSGSLTSTCLVPGATLCDVLHGVRAYSAFEAIAMDFMPIDLSVVGAEFRGRLVIPPLPRPAGPLAGLGMMAEESERGSGAIGNIQVKRGAGATRVTGTFPISATYTLEIYNEDGDLVREFGPVPSGQAFTFGATVDLAGAGAGLLPDGRVTIGALVLVDRPSGQKPFTFFAIPTTQPPSLPLIRFRARSNVLAFTIMDVMDGTTTTAPVIPGDPAPMTEEEIEAIFDID